MTRNRLFLFTMMVFGFFQQLSAEDWTEFRGPTGQGLSSAKNLPVRWSSTENVRWKVEIPGKGWSSPVVFRDRIFLTTSVSRPGGNLSDRSLRALCLDAETGKTLWDREVFDQVAAKTEKIHGKNSHASSTPITDGKHVYVHFGTQGTACLSLDGAIVWKTRKLKYGPRHGNGGSPVLVNGLLIVCCDGHDVAYVVALDKKTGKIRWKKTRPSVSNSRLFSFSTPLVIEVTGQMQVVCPGTDLVIAYEPKTGREIWQVDYDGYSVVPRPVFGHGLVYVCTGWSPPKLLAIRPDGESNVSRTHLEWKITREVSNSPSPLLLGNELYFISDKGAATCVDAKSGNVLWKRRLIGNFSASPLYADGKIYFQSEEGNATVIKAGTTFVELAKNRLGEETLASYAVVDSALLIRTEGHLYRIESQ
ncbi:MAG: PQQ-binding-like beta-propeller repeat protein [Planctomycetes bacterium]|nr:PQQ-binding-like beta-propeller repeat protein [Planctomycetota bacterium]